MPTVTIRAATAADAPLLMRGIKGIAALLGELDEVACSEEDLQRFGFGERPAFEASIAEADGRFAGMCLFFPIFSTYFGRPGVFVQDLYVEETFRGAGIGETLLRHVARLSHERGGVYMRLAVAEQNDRAQEFYRRLGLDWSREERSFISYGAPFAALAAPYPDTGD